MFTDQLNKLSSLVCELLSSLFHDLLGATMKILTVHFINALLKAGLWCFVNLLLIIRTLVARKPNLVLFEPVEHCSLVPLQKKLGYEISHSLGVEELDDINFSF